MFYRYEVLNVDGEYQGIFTAFDPSERSYFNRFLKEPKWYSKNPNVDSKCWFTEEGYKKYGHIIEEMIAEKSYLTTRLITKEKLENVVCKGKIQCIELI